MDTLAHAAEREAALTRALAPIVDELLTPALVIDLDAVEHNVAAVIERLGDPLRWCPHLKTVKHRAPIAALAAAGVRSFKVATLDELDLALAVLDETLGAEASNAEVVVAYPLHAAAARAAWSRARGSRATVTLLADSPDHLDELAGWAAAEPSATARGPARVWLDVDVGMGRTGAPASVWLQALAQRRPQSPAPLEIAGIHGYEGHLAWDERDAAEAGYAALVDLARACPSARRLVTSGTHAFAHALAYPPLRAGPWRHLVSPGTVVLSDLRSAEAAALLGLRCAAFVASRVVSVRDGAGAPRRVTVDAGSKALAPDRPEPAGSLLGWPAWLPSRATEEHRVLQPTTADAPAPARGTVVFIAPSHVCTTVNLYREVVHVRGERLIGLAPIEAGRHTTLAAPLHRRSTATPSPTQAQAQSQSQSQSQELAR